MNIILQKLKTYWPIVIIVFLWVVFSFPYFFKGLVPFPSRYLVTFFPPWNASYGMPVKNNAMPDIISQIYPWKKVTVDTWKSGAVPLWNPYSFSGTKHAANNQSAVFSPVNLLYAVLPFLDAWSIQILLQPLLAGFFMFLFLGTLGCSKLARLIGSIAFMFCGFMTTWMAYGTLGYAILFLPLALWGIQVFFDKQSLWGGIVLTIAVACSFLSGHFQMSLYAVCFILAFLLYRTIKDRAWKKPACRQAGVLVIFVFFLCGILIAFPQLVLSFDAFRDSVRDLYVEKREIIPWQYLLTFFSPDFFGNPVTRNDWFGHYAEWAGYIGVIPLLLSLYAIIRDRKGVKLFFVLGALFSLLLAYNTFFGTIIFFLKIPVLSTSAASRIIVLTSFSLAVLAAFGFDGVFLDWKKKKGRTFIILSVIILVFLLSLWVSLQFFHVVPADKLMVAKRNCILPTGIAIGTIILLGAGFIRMSLIKICVIIVFLGILSYDSYRYVSKWMPFDQRQFVYPLVESIEFLKKQIGNDRVFGGIGNEVGSTFSLQLIEGYDAVYKRRYGQFISSLSGGVVKEGERSVIQLPKDGLYTKEALQLMGVRYILHRISDGRNVWAFPWWQYGDQMNSLYRDGEYEVFEYTSVFPRAFLASSYKIETEDQAIISTLFDQNTDRRTTLVLEEEPRVRPEEGEGNAQIISYQPNRVIIKTTSPAAKLLFLSDTYDEGWNAEIDGKPSKILRADFIFRAVPVEKGEHIVEFYYRPYAYSIAIWASIGGVVTMCCLCIYEVKRRKTV